MNIMFLDIIHRPVFIQITVLFLFKTQRYRDWILTPFSGKTYSVGHLSPEIETTSSDWAQLSKFYLKTETESSLRNVVF
jgi:hypothetical protein